jgi:hypothetical protein
MLRVDAAPVVAAMPDRVVVAKYPKGCIALFRNFLNPGTDRAAASKRMATGSATRYQPPSSRSGAVQPGDVSIGSRRTALRENTCRTTGCQRFHNRTLMRIAPMVMTAGCRVMGNTLSATKASGLCMR